MMSTLDAATGRMTMIECMATVESMSAPRTPIGTASAAMLWQEWITNGIIQLIPEEAYETRARTDHRRVQGVTGSIWEESGHAWSTPGTATGL